MKRPTVISFQKLTRSGPSNLECGNQPPIVTAVHGTRSLTTPIFSDGLTVKLTFLRAGGRWGAYWTDKSSTTSSPDEEGQYAGGRNSLMIGGASWGTSRYSITRSTLLKSNSSCAATLGWRLRRHRAYKGPTYLTNWRLASANAPAWLMTTAVKPSVIPECSAKSVAMNTTIEPKPIKCQNRWKQGVQALTIIAPAQPAIDKPLQLPRCENGFRILDATYINMIKSLKMINLNDHAKLTNLVQLQDGIPFDKNDLGIFAPYRKLEHA